MKTHVRFWIQLVRHTSWPVWLLMCWLVPGRSWAQTIVSEDFDGAWTTPATLATAGTTGTWSDDGTTGDQQWHRNDYTAGWTANSAPASTFDESGTGYYARFHSSAVASGATGSLVSPLLDFSGYAANKLLTFYLTNYTGTDVVNVYLSTDGGLTYGSSLGAYGAASGSSFRPLVVDLGATTSSTVRVKFVATSDGGADDLGIDNFQVANRVRAPFSGAYTIDQAQPGAGTNFTSFTDAINLLNFMGVAGPTTFSISNGQTFTEKIPVITVAGSAASPVTFQEAALTASLADNPTVVAPGTGGDSNAAIIVSGGDYLTFNGLNVQVAAGATAVTYGYVVRNGSATDGATHNTICNAAIVLNRVNSLSTGLLQTTSSFGNGTQPTAATGANQYNTYYNLQIRNVYNGVRLYSISNAYPDYATQLYSCAIGDPAVSGDIGGSNSNSVGIMAANQTRLSLHDNVVRNVLVRGTITSAGGIQISGSSGTGADASNVYNNQVGTVGNTSASSAPPFLSNFCFGIAAATAGSGSHTLNLYNNFVWDITDGYRSSAQAIRNVRGIYIASDGTADQTVNVAFNSVRLETPSTYSASSTCYEISSASGAVVNTRNNSFANFSTGPGSTTARHYAWVSATAGAVGNAGSSSDYNDLYVANQVGTSGFVGVGGTTPSAALADWQAATNQDVHSITADPIYISANDLHLQSASPLRGLGTPVADISLDIDNTLRNPATPDIGADEFSAPLPVVLTDFTAVQQGPDAALTWATASEQHNQGFEVQVSLEGTTFRPLAFVAGAGTSRAAHTYTYLDREAAKSGVRYYRLRQIDLDGTSAYSPVRAVSFMSATELQLTAAPNPFAERLALWLVLPQAVGVGELRLCDLSGRTLRQQPTPSLPVGTSQLELAGLKQLATGVYWLEWVVPGQAPQHLRVVRE